jgi:hypothetical protein
MSDRQKRQTLQLLHAPYPCWHVSALPSLPTTTPTHILHWDASKCVAEMKRCKMGGGIPQVVPTWQCMHQPAAAGQHCTAGSCPS